MGEGNRIAVERVFLFPVPLALFPVPLALFPVLGKTVKIGIKLREGNCGGGDGMIQ